MLGRDVFRMPGRFTLWLMRCTLPHGILLRNFETAGSLRSKRRPL